MGQQRKGDDGFKYGARGLEALWVIETAGKTTPSIFLCALFSFSGGDAKYVYRQHARRPPHVGKARDGGGLTPTTTTQILAA